MRKNNMIKIICDKGKIEWTISPDKVRIIRGEAGVIVYALRNMIYKLSLIDGQAFDKIVLGIVNGDYDE